MTATLVAFVAVVAEVADVAFVAQLEVPNKDPVKFVEVTELSPANVVEDDPKVIAVLPTVTLLFVI